MNEGRDSLKTAGRVVVKIGTNALTNATGRFDRPHFDALASDLLAVAERRELVVVSSGAIALGIEGLGYASRPKDIPGKQACAAVGQSRLMRAYEEAFARGSRTVAQVLLTHEDVQERRRYLNARHTLARLLRERVVPIVNENDTVSVAEIKFGDNDFLAALVAGLVEADALVVLSDVDGLFTADPRRDPSARLVSEVVDVDAAVLALGGESSSDVGTGGMASKVRAAAKVAELGIRAVICSGQQPGVVSRVLAGDLLGTLFEPRESKRTSRQAWIAHALRPRGRLVVDAGARRAVVALKKSLLPSGIRMVEGDFDKGDPVDLAEEGGAVFARGLAAYDADELRRIAGKKSAEIEAILGYRYLDEAVHRDDLVELDSA
ncbi:MAG TPA: glutamate 5-kinase [Myxococcaceae bacterium]|nr:glutamate 5-kinase [Myxococcaceae bacterium]